MSWNYLFVSTIHDQTRTEAERAGRHLLPRQRVTIQVAAALGRAVRRGTVRLLRGGAAGLAACAGWLDGRASDSDGPLPHRGGTA